ncbi:MAG: HAMP domain-containing protein [bacterium]
MLNSIDDSVFSSLLGRRIIFFFLIAGFLPLTLFAFAMYFQSSYLIEKQTVSTLEDYAQLASGNLFQTLKEGEFRLKEQSRRPDSEICCDEYFERVELLDRSQLENDWPGNLTESQFEWLVQGKPAITTPYRRNGFITLSMVVRKSDNRFLVGEFQPEELWQVIRGRNFGRHDVVLVVDQGSILAASVQHFENVQLPEEFRKKVPRDGLGQGEFYFSGIGNSVWISKGLWLAGRYGAHNWHVLVIRPRQSMEYLPRYLVRSLIVFLALATMILVFFAIRFARSIYAPLEDILDAMKTLANGYWFTPVKIFRSDEIGELARVFNRIKEKLQTRLMYLHKVLLHMSEPLLVTDGQGKIKKVNGALVDLCGRSADELVDMSANKLFIDEENMLPFTGDKLEKIVDRGDIRELKLKLKLPEGGYQSVKFSGSVTRKPDGDLDLVILVGRLEST